MTEADN